MIRDYLTQSAAITQNLDTTQIGLMVTYLERLRDRNQRLFIIGNGGGAGHASHAAADFRKIGRIQAYAWGDNTSDATAYINDEGWGNAICHWLTDSRASRGDGLMVFSVGGASELVSQNIRRALLEAKEISMTILGVVGGAGGEVAKYADTCVVIPSLSTPHVEGIQSVVWHLLVTELAAQ